MEEKDLSETINKILNLLPYAEPFRFVDELESIDENGVVGYYTWNEDADFYKGHFPGFPLTPGVLLTECMAQIGMVALGIYLIDDPEDQNIRFAFTSSDVKFLAMVLPGERVKVVSQKKIYRMGMLRCTVEMYLSDGTKAAEGTLSGYRIK